MNSGCGLINSLPNSVLGPWSRSRRATSSDGWPNRLRREIGRRAAAIAGKRPSLLLFRVGIDNEKIDRNPAARIRRKTEGGGRVRFLSDAEEVCLRAAIEHRVREFLPHFLLSIHTGMRMSEQYGLDWSQVDFERRQIHLPKTKNGDPRTIPLNSIALTALKDLDGRGKKMRPTPVFPSIRTGESLQGSRGWFPSALEEAKIEGYTWHCNRHTFASRLVMAGVDLRTVAELLGTGRSRWSCGTPISLPSTRRRLSTDW
jgi:integrase